MNSSYSIFLCRTGDNIHQLPTGPEGSLPGTRGSAHGGPHWDVIDRYGDHKNILPGGKER